MKSIKETTEKIERAIGLPRIEKYLGQAEDMFSKPAIEPVIDGLFTVVFSNQTKRDYSEPEGFFVDGFSLDAVIQKAEKSKAVAFSMTEPNRIYSRCAMYSVQLYRRSEIADYVA